MRKLLLIAGIICSFNIQAQILNVEEARADSDTLKNFTGSLTFDFILNNRSASRQEKVQYFGLELNSDLAYFSKKHVYMLLSNLEYNSVTGDPIIRTGYSHFRINFIREQDISYESFAQIQFDLGRGLNFRSLAGAGLRFSLVDQDKISLYTGTGIMYEHESWENPFIENLNVNRNIWKSTNYLSTVYNISKAADLNFITYYQVGYDQVSEVFRHRVSLDTELVFRISKVMAFSTSFAWAYENRPVVPIVKYLYVLENGIKINF